MTSHLTPERISSIHAHARANGISLSGNRGIKVMRSCTILKPAAELYAFSRKLENLARIIKYPLDILPLDARECLWWLSTVTNGHRVEWNAVIINDEPNRLIAWQTLEGAPVPHAGTIRFDADPAGTGTVVTVQFEYDPPGGKLERFFARLTGDEAQQEVEHVLRRFKELMETGAIRGE